MPKGIRVIKGIRKLRALKVPKGIRVIKELKVFKDKVQAIFTDVRTAFTSRNRIQFFKKGKYMDDKIF